jgi:glycosyltransferase involved in cell wall biosynthesis
MPNEPLLTIVIPTLNRCGLVARALESALAQTSPNIEIIVSDNGSTDDTPAVLAKYEDPRLRKIRHERTMSASTHGNFLIEQARGEFFLGLSDDDYLEPEFAARVLELFARRPALSFVWTGCLIEYASKGVPALTGPETESGPEFIAAFFAGKREVCWCACVTRTAELRRIGPIPEGQICGDMFFWIKLAFQGDVGCVREPVSHYTFMTADNLSAGAPVYEWGREMRALADEAIGLHAKFAGDPSATNALRRDCVRFVARSTANQFVWNAIRGRPRTALLAALPACWRFFAGDPSVWPRVLLALVMPRRVLRSIVLAAAAKRGEARTAARP